MRLLLLAAALCAGCVDRAPPARQTTPALPAPSIAATLDLPRGDGRVHIIVMPTDTFESARCIVAVGPNGQASTACAPKSFDPTPPQP